MRQLSIAALCACLSATAFGQTPAAAPIAARRFTLPNGLRVVFNEDHSVPIVAVDVWYHLGSADENPQQGGFAHACEHTFATGTSKVAGSATTFFRSEGVYSGTATNSWATTTSDYTQFYETAPRPQLDTVLWYEADRMRSPFARADSAAYRGVLEVVREERAQRVDNRIYGETIDLVRFASYPSGNPYRGAIIPPLRALDSAGENDVLRFCRPYYVPNNAVLALSGDITSGAARRIAARYFGDIPHGNPPRRASAARPPLSREQRLVITDPRARVSSIQFAWPAVGWSHRDKMPLYALATLLSGRKYGFQQFGRLSRFLMEQRQLATSVGAEMDDSEGAGDFVIDISPRPGVTLTAIEFAVDSVLATMRDSLVDQSELDAFNRLNAVRAITSLQARSARTDTLAQSELWAHDPNAYAKQIASAGNLTPQDVRRVAREYLTSNRVVTSLVPAGKLDEVSRPELPYTDVTPRAPRKGKP